MSSDAQVGAIASATYYPLQAQAVSTPAPPVPGADAAVSGVAGAASVPAVGQTGEGARSGNATTGGQSGNAGDLKTAQGGVATKHADPKRDAANALADVLQMPQDSVKVSIDKDTQRVVISVVNPQTQQVVRQIPPKQILNMLKSFDHIKGLLVSDRA